MTVCSKLEEVKIGAVGKSFAVLGKRRAISRMGLFAPYVLIDGRECFIAIRAYLDRSGLPASRFVSLAAFGAPDDVWAKFETGWYDILKSAPSRIDYMHMKEAMQRRHGTPFSQAKGWTQENAWTLVFRLVKFMSEFQRTELLNFSCVVDMEAWRKVTGEGVQLPSEIEICNTYCGKVAVAAAVNSLVMANEEEVIDVRRKDLIHFIFDRSEPFFEKFKDEWNAGKNHAEKTGKFSPWQLVDSVTEGSMKTTPGIQAADILAWGLNRENTAPEGHYGTGLADILRKVTAGTYTYVDEDLLRKLFLPTF